MKLELVDIPHIEYVSAYQMQQRLLEARIAAADALPDRLMLVEHEPVYTLGKYASESDVLFSVQTRKAKGITVVQTDRGGQVTYHGPGQITGYPIIRLSTKKAQGVAWYVDRLEEVLIETLAHFELSGGRDAVNPGVWIGKDKVAAIGVRVRRQITMHGFALNVRTNLSHYDGIIPCGIKGRGVTSMHSYLPGIQIEDVKPVLIGAFCNVFGYHECVASKEVLACA